MTMTAGQRFLFLYGAVAIVLCFDIGFGWQAKPRMFETARELVKNHRIVDGDVVPAGFGFRMLGPSKVLLRDFTGRYLARQVDPHGAIDLSLTREQPEFHPGAGAYLVWVPLPQPRDPRVDAGSRVELCGVSAKPAECGSATVAALGCPTPSGDCQVGLWLNRQARTALLAALSAPLAKRPTLRLFAPEAPMPKPSPRKR